MLRPERWREPPGEFLGTASLVSGRPTRADMPMARPTSAAGGVADGAPAFGTIRTQRCRSRDGPGTDREPRPGRRSDGQWQESRPQPGQVVVLLLGAQRRSVRAVGRFRTERARRSFAVVRPGRQVGPRRPPWVQPRHRLQSEQDTVAPQPEQEALRYGSAPTKMS